MPGVESIKFYSLTENKVVKNAQGNIHMYIIHILRMYNMYINVLHTHQTQQNFTFKDSNCRIQAFHLLHSKDSNYRIGMALKII